MESKADAAVDVDSNREEESRVLRKAFRYLVPILFLMYVVSYLDRINIGFAALSMNKDLKLSATMFGLANTVFYLGYAVFEVPSNMMLAKFGGRKWLARIMITWGIASTATMLATSAQSLMFLRLLVGIAEAGFAPGLVLYLTYWFPANYRARATAICLAAQPVTIAIGSPLSGLILDKTNHMFGLVGWQWMFIIEGIPAILLGIVILFYLPDNPGQAKWLTGSQKDLIQRSLAREAAAAGAKVKAKAQGWREVLDGKIVMLSAAYFCVVVGLNTTATWTPQIVKSVLKSHSFTHAGLFIAFPAIITTIAMPIWGARSDRKMERTWHLIAPMLLAAVGWMIVAFVRVPEVQMVGLICYTVGAFVAMAIFWTLPPNILSAAARPVGIAAISTVGILASVTSPVIVGFLKDLTHDWTVGLLFVAAMQVVGAFLVRLALAKDTVEIAAPAACAASLE